MVRLIFLYVLLQKLSSIYTNAAKILQNNYLHRTKQIKPNLSTSSSIFNLLDSVKYSLLPYTSHPLYTAPASN